MNTQDCPSHGSGAVRLAREPHEALSGQVQAVNLSPWKAAGKKRAQGFITVWRQTCTTKNPHVDKGKEKCSEHSGF